MRRKPSRSNADLGLMRHILSEMKESNQYKIPLMGKVLNDAFQSESRYLYIFNKGLMQ